MPRTEGILLPKVCNIYPVLDNDLNCCVSDAPLRCMLCTFGLKKQ